MKRRQKCDKLLKPTAYATSVTVADPSVRRRAPSSMRIRQIILGRRFGKELLHSTEQMRSVLSDRVRQFGYTEIGIAEAPLDRLPHPRNVRLIRGREAGRDRLHLGSQLGRRLHR